MEVVFNIDGQELVLQPRLAQRHWLIWLMWHNGRCPMSHTGQLRVGVMDVNTESSLVDDAEVAQTPWWQ